MKIIKISISRPVTVFMFYLLFIFMGIASFIQLPLEFLPDLGYPKLTVITAYQNAAPPEIEEMITTPIEEVVSTLENVRRVSSLSRDEISIITLDYHWNADMKHAALQLREKLDNLRFRLPDAAERPNIARLDPSEAPIIYLSLSSAATDEISAIQNTTENYIKKRLLQLSGVAAVDIIGNLEEEIEILLDKGKINSLKIEFADIAAQISRANLRIPGGSIKDGLYRYNIRISGEFQSIQDIENTPIYYAEDGTIIFLRDIAAVRRNYKDEKSITRLNRQRSLGLLIRKEAGANTVKVCDSVKELLEDFAIDYPELNFHVSVDHSQFIKASIKGVLEAIILGGLLAFLILFLFLSDLKSPLHIAIVIPIAVLTTFVMMFFGNISLNIISLSGLALGIGMLVDNSIVVSESIFRHQEEGKNWRQAAYDGTREVGLAITASTLTTLAVFLPILYVKGIAASLFRQQALTVTFSLLSSLLVSVTLLPMLAALRAKELKKKTKTLPKITKPQGRYLLPLFWLTQIVLFPFKIIFLILKTSLRFLGKIFGWLGSLLKNILNQIYQSFQKMFCTTREKYLNFLEKSLLNAFPILIFFLLIFLVSLFILLLQPKEFFPQFEQPNFSLLISLEPGTSLAATDEIIKKIENMLESEQRIDYFFTSVGRSTEDKLSYYLEDSQTEHLAEIKVAIHPEYKTAEVINSLRSKITGLPIDFLFNRGDNELLSFLDLGESGLKLRIYGSEYETMEKIAAEVYARLQAHEYFYDISATHKNKAPFIHLKVNREALALYQVEVSTIARALKTYIAGDKISDFYLFNDKIDISLKNESEINLDELLEMQIITVGNLYPLRVFVQAEERLMPAEIEHINQFQVLSFSLRFHTNLQQALQELQLMIEDFEQQEGVFLRIEGLNQQIDESLHSLILALIFAILLVYMILASQFESFLLPLIIMFTVPMGLIGVAWALLISGTSINVMSTLGMIILAGIIVNDAILLVDRINKLHQSGLALPTAIMDAAQTRFRPILMTTLTTVFGLLPLALALGSGAELQSAIAIAVIGGMLSATFLTLIFIPLIYSVLVKDKKQMRKL